MSKQTAQCIDVKLLEALVEEKWSKEIIPALEAFIRVPAKSPAFDAQWAEHGFIDQVVNEAVTWAKQQNIEGLKIEVMQLQNDAGERRTPVIYFEIPAYNSPSDSTVLMYGHLDKQPEFSGWSHGFSPWQAHLVDGKLYGRGAADDGYAIYTSLALAQILQQLGASHPRIVGIFETCEESGSYDLPAYMDELKPRIGNVDMVVCLDSGAGNYEQLWLTSSLRGMAAMTLRVEVLTQGVHSGEASGIVPSSMRIMRLLLDRLEDSRTGRLLPSFFHCETPPWRLDETKIAAQILGESVIDDFPWAVNSDGSKVLPMASDPVQALLGRTWMPTLSITGVDGIPTLENAGNVLRPQTTLKLSFRLPPLVDAQEITQKVQALLSQDLPYHAKVTFKVEEPANGWSLGVYPQWLDDVLKQASQAFYGKPCAFLGEGGSIPLINMLQTAFPQAQMLVCGVLGPGSNAHGPNEFLHIPYAKRLTSCVAQVLAAHP